MNKILIAVAALATFGVASAHADGRDPAERAAFNQTVRDSSVLKLNAPVIVEGRNAAVADATEPYIAQSVAQDARSAR